MLKQIGYKLTQLRETLGKIPFEVSFMTSDYWGLLFIGCLSLYQPKFLFLAVIYGAFRINKRIVLKHKKEAPNVLDHCILCIHMNRLQSLTEAIESNPELLYCEYKKKSLLSWCKFYNNTKALMVINQMTQKYPKKELLAS